MLVGFRLLQASKAFIRKSGVFRFINNPVKTFLNQGWCWVIDFRPITDASDWNVIDLQNSQEAHSVSLRLKPTKLFWFWWENITKGYIKYNLMLFKILLKVM